MIYNKNSYFDSNSLQEGLVQPENDFSKTYEELSYPQNLSTAAALKIELQNKRNLEVDERNLDNVVFMYTSEEMEFTGKNGGEKDSKLFATEIQRRVQLTGMYQALRELIPKPTTYDRASIVSNAIDHIHELKWTLSELKIVIEKKRYAKEGLERLIADEDGVLEQNGSLNSRCEMENPYNGLSLRSSWLHKKSKNSKVDVRIIDDEVNVKLVQQKRVNCLIYVSRVLDELQLDLHHIAGGLIGDYYSFLFNSKVNESSTVYASAIADKVIEVVDKQYEG